MDRLNLEQLTALQRVTACIARVSPTEVEITQDTDRETLTAVVKGNVYTANCAMDSARAAMKDYLKQVVQEGIEL